MAVAVVATLLAGLAASVIVHATWNHERAARSVSTWASKPLCGAGGPTKQAFTFRRIDYPWWPAVRSLLGGAPLPFEAWDIHVWDPAGKEVLHAAHVAGGLRLGRLVFGKLWGALSGHGNVQLALVDVRVDGFGARIAPEPDGPANLVAAFAPRKSTPPDGGGMVIVVDGSTVHDGDFSMQSPGWRFSLTHIELVQKALRYSSFPAEQRKNSPAFTYDVTRVTSPSGSIGVGSWNIPIEDFRSDEFRTDDPRREDMVVDGRARSHGADTRVRGKLTALYGGSAGADLQIEARHGGGFLAQLPSKSYLSGDASATAHITGEFADLTIEGQAKGGELHAVGLEAKRLAAHYWLHKDRLRVSHLTSEVADGHVDGDGELDGPHHRWQADLTLAGIKTLQLGKLAPVEIVYYLATIPGALVKSVAGDGDVKTHLSIEKVDLTLYRRLHERLPHRVVLDGRL